MFLLLLLNRLITLSIFNIIGGVKSALMHKFSSPYFFPYLGFIWRFSDFRFSVFNSNMGIYGADYISRSREI